MTAVLRRFGRWQVATVLILLTAAAALALCVRGGSAGAASDGSRPSGSFSYSGSIVVGCPAGAVLCTQGHISGGINGPFTLTLLTITPSVDPGVNYFAGNLVVRATGGNLKCELNGAEDENPRSAGDFGEICVITGGTGKFAGAKGDLRLMGTSTGLLVPVGSGKYEGEVSTK